jgi:excisionase family DNA binding protein
MNTTNTLIREENNTWRDVLSSKEVCDLLRISIDTLNRYCMYNQIAYTRPSGGKRLFFKKDVLEFIESGRQGTYEEFKRSRNK